MEQKLENVEIEFTHHDGLWHWHLQKGKYGAGGTTNTLLEAESKAYEVAEQLSNTGHIHTTHNPGKPVISATGSIKDAFVND